MAAIEGIAATIEQVSTISTAIPKAVDEQSAATQKIPDDVGRRTGGVGCYLEFRGGEPGGRATGAAEARYCRRRLTVRSIGAMSGEVERFLADVRAA